MQRDALDRLLDTLLVACGLAAGGCALIPSEAPPQDSSDGEEVKTKDTAPLKVDPPQTEEPPLEPEPVLELPTCAEPKPVLNQGHATGYVQCADGSLNRESVVACREPIRVQACAGTERNQRCQSDTDCTDKPRGFCKTGSGQIGSYCSCVYPCTTDIDCGPNEACICPDAKVGGPDVATCAPAECRTNTDCASRECGASIVHDGCDHILSLECRGAEDECRSARECGGRNDCGVWTRNRNADTKWACQTSFCAVGRPFQPQALPRVAALTSGRWGTNATLALGCSPARAAHWTAIALMEHASVASFARFVNELLALAAPPRLVTDALVAAKDEVAHAEDAFRVASAFAGRRLRPGRLVVDDLPAHVEIVDFVVRLIEEGCVGETIGAAEAQAMLDGPLDARLRPIVERIAQDELGHAALAWRTLKWIAPRVEASVIERAFVLAFERIQRVDPETTDPRYGLMGAQARRQLRRHTIEQVLRPCSAALRADQPRHSRDDHDHYAWS